MLTSEVGITTENGLLVLLGTRWTTHICSKYGIDWHLKKTTFNWLFDFPNSFIQSELPGKVYSYAVKVGHNIKPRKGIEGLLIVF